MTLGADNLVLCAGTLPRETSWTDRLDAASNAGFAGISVWARDYAAARGEGWTDEDLRAQLDDHGLAIAELDPAWWWTPGEIDTAALVAIDIMEVFRYGEADMFAIADALGARSINAADVLGGPWGVDDAAAAFAGLCDRAAEHGLLVHLEFLPWSRIADLATAWEVVRRADRPNGGVAVDAWHWFRSDEPSDIATLQAIAGEKILGVQLDDAPAEPEMNLMSATLHERLLPGEGAIDLAALVGTLRDIGVSAPFGVEVFSDSLHALGPFAAAQRAADATRRVLAQSR
ncbi:MAG: sugar phosphate isomerase/epimerase [Actinobacteria bacterium]|nr:sugar phosphate isomerase/epimerase [Actinomycetota bacterium]